MLVAMGRRLVAGAAVMFALAINVATPASAGTTQDLHGVITIDFPDYEKTTGKGCKADAIGSVAKLKKGNRVRVLRGVVEDPASKALDVKKVIGRGKVGKGTINDTTDSCDVAFRVKNAPVLPDDEFYVVEVRGIATTQTVSAQRVVDGDLGTIPAEI
jgi:hypothetical protein